MTSTRTLLTAVAAALALTHAGPGHASEIQAKLRLTSSTPNTPTAGYLDLVRPVEENGKPKTETMGVFTLPAGTRIDQAAVPPCEKDDVQLRVEGHSACPESHVGTGFASVHSGLGPPVDPFVVAQQWYFAPGELVALYTKQGTRAPIISIGRVQIRGTSFVAPLDLPPGYPPGTKSSPGETQLSLGYIGRKGSLLTTPPTCPPDGKWVSTVELTYEDGSKDVVRDTTPCQRPNAIRATCRRAGTARSGCRRGRRAGSAGRPGR